MESCLPVVWASENQASGGLVPSKAGKEGSGPDLAPWLVHGCLRVHVTFSREVSMYRFAVCGKIPVVLNLGPL